MSHDPNLFSYNLNQVVGVIINNRGSKADMSGEGFRFDYDRVPVSQSCAIDFVAMLFEWSIVACLLPSQPFLSYRGRWKLQYSLFQKAIKKVASAMGLDATRFSSHSFRIGGASAMAAAGVHDYVIQKIGRWKSLTFLQYIRTASAVFNLAFAALVNPNSFTMADLVRLNSGADFLPR